MTALKKGDRVRVYCVNARYSSDNWVERVPDVGGVHATSFKATVVQTFDRGLAIRVKHDGPIWGYGMVHRKACRRLKKVQVR